jgi:hypothetical protein
LIRRMNAHPSRPELPILGTRSTSSSPALLPAHLRYFSGQGHLPIVGTCRTMLIDTLTFPQYTRATPRKALKRPAKSQVSWELGGAERHTRITGGKLSWANGRDAAMRRNNSRGPGISVTQFGSGRVLLE